MSWCAVALFAIINVRVLVQSTPLNDQKNDKSKCGYKVVYAKTSLKLSDTKTYSG